MVYKSFDQLNGKTLRKGDQVVIKEQTYRVYTRYLENLTGISNAQALIEIGIEDHKSFVEAAYGYESTGGAWPECKDDDMEALTRAVLLTMAMHEDIDIELQMPDGSWKEFKVKDHVPYKSKVLKVSEKYSGHFSSKGLHVGCQTITFDTVENIYKEMKAFKKALKSR